MIDGIWLNYVRITSDLLCLSSIFDLFYIFERYVFSYCSYQDRVIAGVYKEGFPLIGKTNNKTFPLNIKLFFESEKKKILTYYMVIVVRCYKFQALWWKFFWDSVIALSVFFFFFFCWQYSVKKNNSIILLRIQKLCLEMYYKIRYYLTNIQFQDELISTMIRYM